MCISPHVHSSAFPNPPLHCRLAILYHDWLGVKKLLARAKAICEAGGDWEHKNKLKVGLDYDCRHLLVVLLLFSHVCEGPCELNQCGRSCRARQPGIQIWALVSRGVEPGR